jgi:hypothetical protein
MLNPEEDNWIAAWGYGNEGTSGPLSPLYRGTRTKPTVSGFIGILSSPKAWFNSLPQKSWQTAVPPSLP